MHQYDSHLQPRPLQGLGIAGILTFCKARVYAQHYDYRPAKGLLKSRQVNVK